MAVACPDHVRLRRRQTGSPTSGRPLLGYQLDHRLRATTRGRPGQGARRTGERWKSASAVSDPDGRGPRLLFQGVPEPKRQKNRVHLDLNGWREEPDDERRAKVDAALGRALAWARPVRLVEDGERHYVMQDPEGNEFCVNRSVTAWSVAQANPRLEGPLCGEDAGSVARGEAFRMLLGVGREQRQRVVLGSCGSRDIDGSSRNSGVELAGEASTFAARPVVPRASRRQGDTRQRNETSEHEPRPPTPQSDCHRGGPGFRRRSRLRSLPEWRSRPSPDLSPPRPAPGPRPAATARRRRRWRCGRGRARRRRRAASGAAMSSSPPHTPSARPAR